MNNTEVAKLFNEAMSMGVDLTPLAEWLQSTIEEEKAQREYAQLPYTTSSEEVVIYGPGDVEVLRIDAFSENTLADINAAVGQELGRDDLQLWGYAQDSTRVNQTEDTRIVEFDRKDGNIYFYLPEVAKPTMTRRVPTRMTRASKRQAAQYSGDIADMFRQYGLDPSTKYTIKM